jgi:hypothetical protein
MPVQDFGRYKLLPRFIATLALPKWEPSHRGRSICGAKTARSYLFLQIPVGGGNDPYIRVSGFCPLLHVRNTSLAGRAAACSAYPNSLLVSISHRLTHFVLHSSSFRTQLAVNALLIAFSKASSLNGLIRTVLALRVAWFVPFITQAKQSDPNQRKREGNETDNQPKISPAN